MTQPDPQPTTAAALPAVPLPVETTETVPLPLAGATPYRATPYAGGPYSSVTAAPHPHPVPSASPASKRLGLLIFGVVLLMLAGVATVVLISRTPVSPIAAATARPAGRSATPRPRPTPTAFSGDLRTLLLPVPAGATTLPNTNIGNADGTVTIDQAADTFVNADRTATTAYLKSLGYVQGATVGWKLGGSNTSVHVELFQFSPTMTERWLRGIIDRFNTSDRVDARGDLPGIPGGRYYVFTHTGTNGAYAIECYFTTYDIAADVWMYTPDKPDPADLIALAQQQHARLP